MPLITSTNQPRINKRSLRAQREASRDDEQITGARFFNRKLNVTVIRIDQGSCYVTGSDAEMLSTVLGSCISACVRDTELHIGGMNHFLLPASEEASWTNKQGDIASAHLRYGNFAMEQLINGILKRGGTRENLEIKIFGGGNVLKGNGGVGHRNADFVEQYLRDEGYTVAAADLRGDLPRKIQYFPTTGRVQMKKLDTQHSKTIIREEENRRKKTRVVEEAGSIELWD